MKEMENLRGARFGKLTAVSPAPPAYTKSGAKRAMWLCICDCGRARIARADYLKRGQVTYCGRCYRPNNSILHAVKCKCCQYSTLVNNEWKCRKELDPKKAVSKCEGFWCLPYNKLTGTKTREGRCIVCGEPTYNISDDAPIYCLKHREQLAVDDKILDEAPRELLFSLVAGVFLRAREDYLTNADGQHSDASVFLKSQWAQDLSISGFDANKVIEQLNEEIENGL